MGNALEQRLSSGDDALQLLVRCRVQRLDVRACKEYAVLLRFEVYSANIDAIALNPGDVFLQLTKGTFVKNVR